jgi:hypothetical protein
LKTPENIAQVRNVVLRVARESGLPAQVVCPAAVWDTGGQMIGVVISSPKVMGDQPCMVTATFAFDPTEYVGAEGVLKITNKASIAMNAIRHAVQVKIRPVKGKA